MSAPLTEGSTTDPLREPIAQTCQLLVETAQRTRQKDPALAREFLRQAAELARSAGGLPEEARALQLLGVFEVQAGRLEEAGPPLDRALGLARDAAGVAAPGGGARELLAACLNGLGLLRVRQGRAEDGLALLRESLSLTTENGGAAGALAARAETLETLGTFYRDHGESSQALRYYEEALEIRRATGDEAGVAACLNYLGNLRHRLGQFQEAISCFREALAKRRALEDRRGAAATANNLAMALMFQGELDEAKSLLEESRALFDSLGEGGSVAMIFSNLGLLAGFRGEMEEARRLYESSLRVHEERGDPSGQAHTLNNLANLSVEWGRPEQAIAYADRSLKLLLEAALHGALAKPLYNKGLALVELGRLEEARAAADQAVQHAERAASDEQSAEALALRALVEGAEGRPAPAAASIAEAVARAERAGDPLLLATCCYDRGRVHLAAGALDEAGQDLSRASRAIRSAGYPYLRGRIALAEGETLSRAGSREAAAERLRRAEREFRRIGNQRWRLRAFVALARALDDAESPLAEEAREQARRVARDSGLEPLLAALERDPAAADAPGSGGGAASGARASLSPAFDWLVATLLGAATRQAAELAPYLDPFFQFLRRELRAEAVLWYVTPAAAARWTRSGTPRPGDSFRVSRGERPEELAQLRQLAGAPLASALLPAAGCLAFIAGDAERAGAGSSRLTTAVGLEERPLGHLLVLRDESAPFAAAERESAVTAARVLAIAVEGHLDRLDRRAAPSPPDEDVTRFETLIGSSRGMQQVYQLITQVAPTESTVLLLGESGTGKELVARAIHARSRKPAGPFFAISCPSIPRELIESELFGHEKGAFTGAVASRPGKVEMADGGTLFLDEVGDMALPTQAKLLRFLEEREFHRVGGTRGIRVDVRLLAATSRDLAAQVASGEFREDLYYRLNVVPVQMPPLRERREDIPSIAEHFLRRVAKERGGRPRRLSAGALDLLLAHDWPGNVRELRNAIEYADATCHGEVIEASHVAPRVKARVTGVASRPAPLAGRGETLESRLMETEAGLVRATLEAEGWNQSAAARRLGISEGKIRKCMRQYGIRRPGAAMGEDHDRA